MEANLPVEVGGVGTFCNINSLFVPWKKERSKKITVFDKEMNEAWSAMEEEAKDATNKCSLCKKVYKTKSRLSLPIQKIEVQS